MVGLRDFEKDKNNCDLLEIYTDYDKETLKRSGEVDNDFINSDISKKSGKKTNDLHEDIVFTDKQTDEYEMLMQQPMPAKAIEDETIYNYEDENEIKINVDDI
jgi:hypothetical protein